MDGLDEATVRAALEDHRTAPIDERLRAALGIVQKLTLEPESFGPDDIEAGLAAGLDEQAIHEAMYVCFAFNVIDRLADAFDFSVEDAEHQRFTAKFLVRFGYWAAALPQ